MQKNSTREGTNIQNENNRQIKEKITGKSEDKNDGIQLSTRYQQYDFAKRHLRGTSGSEVLPFKEGNRKALKQIIGGGQGNRVYDPTGVSCTIASQAGGQGAKTGLYAMQWRRTEKGKEARRESQKNGRDYTPFSQGHRELVPKPGKVVGALTAQAIAKDSLLGNDSVIRRLTPKETERLQGFEDGWTEYGADGENISDTQRYKMMGNAVTTNVVSAIIERLAQSINIK